MAKFDFSGHFLVPKHDVLSASEEKKLLQSYSIEKADLPRIKANDPAVTSLNVSPGNIIRIERNSPIGGKTYYYRLVE